VRLRYVLLCALAGCWLDGVWLKYNFLIAER
jgi:hypothetical protein